MTEYNVAPGEHIATVRIYPGEVTKVTFDKSYYFFYVYWIGGQFGNPYIRVGGEPEVDPDTWLPLDGTQKIDISKGYSNSFHESYSNSIYILQYNSPVTAQWTDLTIIATNNKNVNI